MMGAGNSTFFRLPKGTPKLLAKLASVLVADAGVAAEKLPDANGEDRGTWDVVRRLL